MTDTYMRVKEILDEDFTNYTKPSMFIGSVSCNGKCCIEAGIPLSVCQNDGWRSCAPVVIKTADLCERYMRNKISQAIVFGGLEPFEQFAEVEGFIRVLRQEYSCDDDVVIYTGYNKDEIEEEIDALKNYKNVIVKFGRFIPDMPHRFDDVLGVELVSDNQYAERIS